MEMERLLCTITPSVPGADQHCVREKGVRSMHNKAEKAIVS